MPSTFLPLTPTRMSCARSPPPALLSASACTPPAPPPTGQPTPFNTNLAQRSMPGTCAPGVSARGWGRPGRQAGARLRARLDGADDDARRLLAPRDVQRKAHLLQVEPKRTCAELDHDLVVAHLRGRRRVARRRGEQRERARPEERADAPHGASPPDAGCSVLRGVGYGQFRRTIRRVTLWERRGAPVGCLRPPAAARRSSDPRNAHRGKGPQRLPGVRMGSTSHSHGNALRGARSGAYFARSAPVSGAAWEGSDWTWENREEGHGATPNAGVSACVLWTMLTGL